MRIYLHVYVCVYVRVCTNVCVRKYVCVRVWGARARVLSELTVTNKLRRDSSSKLKDGVHAVSN